MGKIEGSQASDFAGLSVKLIFVALIAGVSLAINPWGFNLFAIPKFYLLVNLTLLLAAAAFLRFFLGGTFRLPSKPILITFVLFFLLIVASTLFSVLPLVSFMGKMPRYEGLVSWFCYGAIFLLSYLIVDEDKDRELFLWTVTAVVLLVSLYGILQALGIDFIKWRPGLAQGRIRSTIGNPASLGGFFALTLPFLIAAIVARKQKEMKIILWIAASFGVVALFLTGTRGAWLGFALASFACLAIIYKDLFIERKRLGIALIVATVVFVMVLTGAMISLEGERGTASGRLILWGLSIKATGDRPLFGWGPETFQYVFPRYISKTYQLEVTRKTIVDSAHNLFLQNTFNSGLPTTAVLVTFLIFVFLTLFKQSLPMDNVNLFVLGTAAGSLGYLVSLQFHFSTVAVSPLFWAMLGAGLSASDKRKSEQISSGMRYALLSIAAFLLVMWLFVSLVAARMVMADVQFRQGLAGIAKGRLPQAIGNLMKAEKLQPFEEYYPLNRGQILLEWGKQERSLDLLKEAEKDFGRAKRLNPLDEYVFVGLGDLEYAKWEISGSRDFLSKAAKYYGSVLKVDPNFSEVRQKLARAKEKISQKK